MNKTTDVFKRYEKKYLITQEQFHSLTPILGKHMQTDQYGKHTICNIYYDTPDYQLIRTSIEGPKYKEKLRLRSYGIPSSGTTVFIELKKKFDGIVYKRRIPVELSMAYAYLNERQSPGFHSQILREVDWVMDLYRPIPCTYLAYDRVALFGNENPELRITFDFHIRCRQNDLELCKGAYGTPLLGETDILMEVKIDAAMPLWMSRLFSDLHIFPISFSKYGQYYKQFILNAANGKEGDFCA